MRSLALSCALLLWIGHGHRVQWQREHEASMKSLAKLLLTSNSATAWTATGLPMVASNSRARSVSMMPNPGKILIDLEDPEVKAEFDLWEGKSVDELKEVLMNNPSGPILPPQSYGEFELRQMVVTCEMIRKKPLVKKDKYSHESERLYYENKAYRELVDKYKNPGFINEFNFVKEYVASEESKKRLLGGFPNDSPFRLKMEKIVEEALKYKEELKTGKLKYGGWPGHFNVERLKVVFEEFGEVEDLTVEKGEYGMEALGTVVFKEPAGAQALIDKWEGQNFGCMKPAYFEPMD